MLYDGPWAESVIAFDPGMPVGTQPKIGWSRALSPGSHGDESPPGRLDGVFGVQVDGQIQAVALYRLSGTASIKRIMHLLIAVAEAHRRQGMGTALLMRCTTVARQGGLHYLVLEDIDADALQFARMASAELVFSNGECQGWIELDPVSSAFAATEFADVRHHS